MKRIGGGGLLIVGIFLVLLGALIQSDILEWLLNIVGFVIVVAGIIVGIFGLVRMFTGSKGASGDY